VDALRHRVRRFRPGTHVRRLLGVATITAVALATVLGGHRYLFCRTMGEVMTRATCECAQRHIDDESGTAVSPLNDCFEVRFVDRLSSATVDPTVIIAAAPILAVLPIEGFALWPSKSVVTRADHPIRAGPYSPTAVRAQLMVFLT
jgi:hypothetical protein